MDPIQIAAKLTKKQRTAVVNYGGFPQDGRLTLPDGTVLELGSWDAAMDLKAAILGPQTKSRGGGKLKSAWARKAYAAGLIG